MTKGILDAVNSMMVDILATMACKDYEQRRSRAAQGIARRKARLGDNAYLGRLENKERNEEILVANAREEEKARNKKLETKGPSN
jgi:hypothetical protein